MIRGLGGHRHRAGRLFVGVVASLALVAAACGDDGEDDAATGTTSPATSTPTSTTTLAPRSGGTLTIGQFAATTGFDPANVTVAGSTNGLELAALYGTLLRYDPDKAVYQGEMADSISSSADFTTWTLKLRPNVKFTDGSTYDAAAVKLNIERHMTTTARSSAKPALLQFVDSITTPDTTTVVFKLKKGWAGFPFLLTVGPGMIASPASIEKAGTNFMSAPGDAGAGPFRLTSFKPNEVLVLSKNTGYWNGAPYLDEVRFTQLGTADQTYQALKNNTLQAAYLRDPIALAAAKKDGYNTALVASPGGNIALLNSGIEVTCTGGAPAVHCTGKADGTKVKTNPPTADPKVRLAVAYAIDRKAVNDRVWNGTAVVGAQLIDKSLSIYSDVTFPDHNPTEAKRLVSEAKANGWNGNVKVIADQTNSAWGITIKTLLEAAGMTVDLDTSKPLSGVITQVAANRDFEIASWGSGMDTSDADYFFTSTNFGTGGRYGLSSAKFDAALDQLRLASTAEQKKAGYKALSEAWAADMPAVPIATVFQGLVYPKTLNGVVLSGGGIVFLSKAWLAA